MLRTAAALYSLLLTAGVLGARVRRDDAYGAPEAPSYHEPEESYGAPDTSYSAPAYSAPGETGLDLTTLLIPLLALVGLFLLFPTYVTLTSVRRKREAGDENAEVNMVERIADMYQAIIESEECLERVACDVGAMAAESGMDTSYANLASLMVPSKFSKYAKQFASGSKCEKIKCGNLF